MDTELDLYHGSPAAIAKITASGVFGGVFASHEGAARSHGAVLHLVRSPRPLTDYALNYEIEGAWEAAVEVAGGDEDLAGRIMDIECPASDDCEPEDAGEDGWNVQRLRGVLAARLGFTSVEMRDEHGTTWLCLPGCEIAAA